MTSDPFPAATPAAGAATADPTAVVGRRIGAIVIDLLLYTLVMAFVGPTPLSPLAEYDTVGNAVGDACARARDLNDDVESCIEIGDRVYVTRSGDAPAQVAVWVAFLGLYAALQGATGRTPGKALFGVKVVDEQGGPPGFGRSLGRTALWIVDGQPCGIPLVGFITGLTTKGHRRVGDMACTTYVVDKGHTGAVVVPDLAAAATGPYGGSPGGGGAAWGPAPPVSGEPGPAPPGDSTPAESTPGGSAPPAYDPQWDPTRGTYIVWEPQRGQWLGWDEAARQWRPL